MESEKRLVRPRSDRVIGGVCSGFARFFGLDPTLIRLAWVLLICLAGTGFLAYLVCWVVIPEE